jgi:hypothetical protein
MFLLYFNSKFPEDANLEVELERFDHDTEVGTLTEICLVKKMDHKTINKKDFYGSLFPTDNGYNYIHLEKNSLEEIDPTLFIVKQSPSFFGKFRYESYKLKNCILNEDTTIYLFYLSIY